MQVLIRPYTSHYVLLATSQPAVLIDHPGASKTIDLLKRTVVVINPITSKVMELRTPWPMIVGQTLFSLAMAWFGRCQKKSPNQQTDQLPNPPVYKQIIWAVNLVRSTVAAILQMIKIIKGGRRDIPSAGEAIVFAAVLVTSFSFVTGIVVKVAGYIVIAISFIGLLFYIASGILAWVSNGISKPCSSQGFGLPLGCTFGNSSALYSVPCTSISFSDMTSGDWAYFVAWARGAAWFGQHVLLPLLCLDSCDFFACRRLNVDVRGMNHFTIAAMGVGGLLSCTSAGFNCILCKESIWFLEFMGTRQGAGGQVSLYVVIAGPCRTPDSFHSKARLRALNPSY